VLDEQDRHRPRAGPGQRLLRLWAQPCRADAGDGDGADHRADDGGGGGGGGGEVVCAGEVWVGEVMRTELVGECRLFVDRRQKLNLGAL